MRIFSLNCHFNLNIYDFFYSLICAKTDQYCNILCGGFTNSEIRLWDLGQNNINRRVNRNISEVELACNVPHELVPDSNTL